MPLSGLSLDRRGVRRARALTSSATNMTRLHRPKRRLRTGRRGTGAGPAPTSADMTIDSRLSTRLTPVVTFVRTAATRARAFLLEACHGRTEALYLRRFPHHRAA